MFITNLRQWSRHCKVFQPVYSSCGHLSRLRSGTRGDAFIHKRILTTNTPGSFLSISPTSVFVKVDFHCSPRSSQRNEITPNFPDELKEFMDNVQHWMTNAGRRRWNMTYSGMPDDLGDRKQGLLHLVKIWYEKTAPYCVISERKRLPWFRNEYARKFEDSNKRCVQLYTDKNAIQTIGPEMQKAGTVLDILVSNNQFWPDKTKEIEHGDKTKEIAYEDISTVINKAKICMADMEYIGTTCASPDGTIHMPTQQVASMPTEALVAVLAHELTHIVLNHQAEEVAVDIATRIIMQQCWDAMTWNRLTWNRPDSRERRKAEELTKELLEEISEIIIPHRYQFETEADLVGLQMIARSGAYPAEYGTAFVRDCIKIKENKSHLFHKNVKQPEEPKYFVDSLTFNPRELNAELNQIFAFEPFPMLEKEMKKRNKRSKDCINYIKRYKFKSEHPPMPDRLRRAEQYLNENFKKDRERALAERPMKEQKLKDLKAKIESIKGGTGTENE